MQHAIVNPQQNAAMAANAEVWQVCKEHLLEGHKSLVYLVDPSMPNSFPSFEAAAEYIKQSALPVGWVARLLTVAQPSPIPAPKNQVLELSDGKINEITMDNLGKWPSFEAQSWACKVVHAVAAASATAVVPTESACEEAGLTETQLYSYSAVREAIASALTGVYYCNRVWSAWAFGTMHEDDFTPADQVDEVLDELTKAAIGAMVKA